METATRSWRLDKELEAETRSWKLDKELEAETRSWRLDKEGIEREQDERVRAGE